MKRTGFTGYVFHFSVDHHAVKVDDIKDIHNYLKEKNNIVYMKILEFVQKVFVLGLTILSVFTNANYLSFILMNNHECKTRPQVVNVNVDGSVFSF